MMTITIILNGIDYYYDCNVFMITIMLTMYITLT